MVASSVQPMARVLCPQECEYDGSFQSVCPRIECDFCSDGRIQFDFLPVYLRGFAFSFSFSLRPKCHAGGANQEVRSEVCSTAPFTYHCRQGLCSPYVGKTPRQPNKTWSLQPLRFATGPHLIAGGTASPVVVAFIRLVRPSLAHCIQQPHPAVAQWRPHRCFSLSSLR